MVSDTSKEDDDRVKVQLTISMPKSTVPMLLIVTPSPWQLLGFSIQRFEFSYQFSISSLFVFKTLGVSMSYYCLEVF